MEKILFVWLLLSTIQSALSEISFRWCALPKEKAKCDDFMKHVNTTAQNMTLNVKASCVDGTDADDCMEKINKGEADLVTLDGGNTYSAGEKYDFRVIVSEQYGEYDVKYYAVAIVKKANTGFDLKTLKGKKSCHTQADKNAGWKISVGFLLRSGIMDPVDCANPYKSYLSASKFFSESCVPRTKGKVSADVYQKVQNLCSLCDGPEDDKCSVSSSDYHKEAFKCMKDGKGDVAFVKIEMDSPKPFYDEANKTAYQYLCANGGRMEIGHQKECNLGASPAHAVVTRKENSDIEDIIKILTAMSDKYGRKQTNWNDFQLFNSTKYDGGKNLIFKDATTALKGIATDDQSYMGYLGDVYGKDVKALTSCDDLSSTSTMISPVTGFLLITAVLNALLM